MSWDSIFAWIPLNFYGKIINLSHCFASLIEVDTAQKYMIGIAIDHCFAGLFANNKLNLTWCAFVAWKIECCSIKINHIWLGADRMNHEPHKSKSLLEKKHENNVLKLQEKSIPCTNHTERPSYHSNKLTYKAFNPHFLHRLHFPCLCFATY